METRVKNLEDLCELITKEIVEQNKNMIEINKNLITEMRALREAFVKQDVSCWRHRRLC
jgi:t-SNARE complex subunit (syntaxin)